MPPSDDISDYLSALNQAKASQQAADAKARQDELTHARELAVLKAQERAEDERLLKLRIQANEKGEGKTREKRLQQQSWTEKANRQWDETLAEYARRLTALGLAELGYFSFNPQDYDIGTGHFPLPQQIEWRQEIHEDQKPLAGLLWIAPDREAARVAVAAGKTPLLGTLTARGKNFGIKEFAINVADRPHLLRDRRAEEAKSAVAEIFAAMVSIKKGILHTKHGYQVCVDQPYSICKFPVTQQWYRAVMGAAPNELYDSNQPLSYAPNYPETLVSWGRAMSFCQRLNQLAVTKLTPSQTFSLPTEAQWEYACRAGSVGSFGLLGNGHEGTVDQMAWHHGNSGGGIHPVGQKQPNAFGLYDMHGNIFEWCEDRHEQHSQDRVMRGGCAVGAADNCSADWRFAWAPEWHLDSNVGFRVVIKSIE